MLDIRCDVDLDGLLGKFQGAALEAAVSDVCESDILPDCNKVIPKRSGALVSSGHVNGDEITWSAVHASRVFHTNRNGGNKWDSRAWHRNKRKWGQALARRITQDD